MCFSCNHKTLYQKKEQNKVWPEVCLTSGLNPSSSVVHLRSCGLWVAMVSTELYLFTTADVKLVLALVVLEDEHCQWTTRDLVMADLQAAEEGWNWQPPHVLSFFSSSIVNQMSPLVIKFFPVGDIWECETWIPRHAFQILACVFVLKVVFVLAHLPSSPCL